MNVKIFWEKIDQTDDGVQTFRAKIHGGWLVRVTKYVILRNNEFGNPHEEWLPGGITFVSDPDHAWPCFHFVDTRG